MTGPRPASPDADRDGIRPGTLLAVAFVLLLVVAAFIVAAAGGRAGSDDPGGGAAATTSGAELPGAERTGRAGGPPSARSQPPAPSGLASPGEEVPTAPPAGVRWEIYRTVAVPVLPSAGPATVSGDVATGYAHTPVGALVASQQIAVRKVLAPDWRAVVVASIAPGPGRDAWVAARARVGVLAPPAPGQLGQLAGFRFVDYTGDRAVIQVVTRFSTGRLQLTTSTMAWDGRDWRLVLQPDGGESPTVQTVASLAGFVGWGGL